MSGVNKKGGYIIMDIKYYRVEENGLGRLREKYLYDSYLFDQKKWVRNQHAVSKFATGDTEYVEISEEEAMTMINNGLNHEKQSGKTK